MKRPVGIITAKVLKAMKLRKSDLLGSSDPYVKLKLSEEKMIAKKTTVKHQNLNPEWNEEFNMLVKDKENQVLKLTVFDWDKVYINISLAENCYLRLRSRSLSELNVVLVCLLRLGSMKRWV